MFVLDRGEDLDRLAVRIDRAGRGGKTLLLLLEFPHAQCQQCLGRETYQFAGQHLPIAVAAQRIALVRLGQLLFFEKRRIAAELARGNLG